MHLTLDLLSFVEWKYGVGVVVDVAAVVAVGSVMLEFDAVEVDSKWLYWTIDYCLMNSTPKIELNFECEMNRCSVGVQKMRKEEING